MIIGVIIYWRGKFKVQVFAEKYYRRFGHSKEQTEKAWRFGVQIGEAL